MEEECKVCKAIEFRQAILRRQAEIRDMFGSVRFAGAGAVMGGLISDSRALTLAGALFYAVTSFIRLQINRKIINDEAELKKQRTDHQSPSSLNLLETSLRTAVYAIEKIKTGSDESTEETKGPN